MSVTPNTPRFAGQIDEMRLGHRVRTVNLEGDAHLSGLTGTIRAIRPQPITKTGKPVAALKYTHRVQFDEPLPNGLTGAWFRLDELEDLGEGGH